MVGPVLYQEMLLGSRRSQWHWLRWLYAGWLVLQLLAWLFVIATVVSMGGQRRTTLTDLAEFARQYLDFFAAQHFLILTLTAPVLVAGAVTDEKWRGTLQYLLTADLLPWEILVGKLIGRVYQGTLLALVGLPLVCFLGPFAGVGPTGLLCFLYATALLLFFVGSVSLLASVWCRHTRDAVLWVYVAGALVVLATQAARANLAGPLAGTDEALSCFNVLAPLGEHWAGADAAELGRRAALLTLVWGGVGLACLLVATVRLRGAYMRQLESSGRKRVFRVLGSRPRVGNAPLTWKERHVEGIAPLAVLRRIPTWAGVALVFVLTVASFGWVIVDGLPPDVPPARFLDFLLTLDYEGVYDALMRTHVMTEQFYWRGCVVMLVTSFVIGVRCSGAVSGERERMTWEALLLTPLETTQLIRGKLWGIAGASVPYLLAYAVPSLLLAALAGPGAVWWTALWLGVTVLSVFYVGAAGIWCSVRAGTSWRSLLYTLAFIYLGGVALFCVLSFVAGVLFLFLMILLALTDLFLERYLGMRTALARAFISEGDLYYTAFCLAMALTFVLLAWLLLRGAEYRVGMMERVKHWKDEPRHPFRRRRRRRRRYEEVGE